MQPFQAQGHAGPPPSSRQPPTGDTRSPRRYGCVDAAAATACAIVTRSEDDIRWVDQEFEEYFFIE